jgi:hypothetical protein
VIKTPQEFDHIAKEWIKFFPHHPIKTIIYGTIICGILSGGIWLEYGKKDSAQEINADNGCDNKSAICAERGPHGETPHDVTFNHMTIEDSKEAGFSIPAGADINVENTVIRRSGKDAVEIRDPQQQK